MPAYLLLDIEVTDADAYAKYKELGPPTVAAYGGHYLARGGSVESLFVRPALIRRCFWLKVSPPRRASPGRPPGLAQVQPQGFFTPT